MTAATLIAAARGDLAATRLMVEAAYASRTGDAASIPLAYMEAITMARLAAAHGDAKDGRVIVFLLSEFAAFWREHGNDALAVYFEAQALHVAEAYAEDGDQDLADMVAAAADKLPEAVHIAAKQMRGATA